MDWQQLITTLGSEIGILNAAVLAGLVYAYWAAQKRNKELTERLIEQAQSSYAEAAKREAETLVSLQTISNSLNTIIALRGVAK